MIDLRSRLILWHKLIAQITGSMSLCYGKDGLKRGEALAWADRLDDVATDIRNAMSGAPSILDDKGRRLVDCNYRAALASQPRSDELPSPRTATGVGAVAKRHRHHDDVERTDTAGAEKGEAHALAVATKSSLSRAPTDRATTGPTPGGGPKIARRKTK